MPNTFDFKYGVLVGACTVFAGKIIGEPLGYLVGWFIVTVMR